MSNPVKEKITTNLEKAKGEGKIRSENIREIVKDAVAQTVAELKEGSNEIRLIVKDAISTVISDLKGSGKETTEKITASIEGAITGSTYQRQQAIAQRQAKLLEIQALLDQEQLELDQEISDVLIDIKAAESTDFADNDPEAISTAVNTVKERHESGILEKQYHKIKSQLAGLDQKLAIRYGDRYTEVKQQWEQAKTWYDQKRTEAEASKTIPLHEKQAEIEHNFGDFGATVARKEQEIKHQVQKLWGNDPKR
jgi:7-cyano-7-deazaguanine synthase in queuosine biosynthesis